MKDLLKKDGVKVRKDYLKNVYAQFDIDGDGKVTLKDLEKVLEQGKEFMK